MAETTESGSSSLRWVREAGVLTQVAIFLIIIATSWYMLKELAELLRPLLLAVLVCYIVIPMGKPFPKGQAAMKTILLLVSAALIVVLLLGLLLYGSLLQFNDQLPHLTERAKELGSEAKQFLDSNAPGVSGATGDLSKIETMGETKLSEVGGQMLRITANVLVEAVVVGLYVIFLLVEGHRLERRVERGFSNERAAQILDSVQRINHGISHYMRAKVKTSLILAVPVAVFLWIFGVKFALAWGLLTFACNFIPYVGSVISFTSPLLFAFLDLPPGWQPYAVLGGLLFCHIGTASFVEPTMIGKAVGLSPLAVLLSLTFWGLCWGVVGMFLAIPLTVTMVIIMENLGITRPIAKLLGDK